MANADLASPPQSAHTPAAHTPAAHTPAAAHTQDAADAQHARASLVVSLSSTSADLLGETLFNLQQAFTGDSVIVVSPDISAPDSSSFPGLTLLPHGDGIPIRSSWTLTAPEFISGYQQAVAHGGSACLLLGPDAHALSAAAIRGLSSSVLTGGADLCTPDYALGPREGLVNSALLYPLSRSLYNAPSRFPLAVDMGVSLRLAERLSLSAQRIGSSNPEEEAIIWPVAEAAVAGMSVTEVSVTNRSLPTPNVADLNTLLGRVLGSFFNDIEQRASFWQRSRPSITTRPPAPVAPAEPVDPGEVQPLIDGFRVAYTNLADIWSLVIPPQSLLGLKKLSTLDQASFSMPANLWARITYDFVLAWRLRTINRGHLIGALTPLYLAWVASHLLLSNRGDAPGQHVEETAAAFAAEKPYFVSRWRWPDRFNP